MANGSRCGGRERHASLLPRLDTFIDDDGGYTTVAVACALLVSLALVCSTAAAVWTSSRSSDVQTVADAAAMSGANVVAGYSTVAQVLDACVLSMGLTGASVMAAGMVVSAIPLLQEAAPRILDMGRKILDARRSFATSAAEGLQRLERAIPALVAANAASTASANSGASMRYAGTALPMPLDSQSDFSCLDDGLDGEEMERQAKELQEASARKAEADRRVSAAKERAWRADTVDDPLCMRSRAESLAGLSGAQNPAYPSVAEWRFEYARARAENYYYVRWQREAASGNTPDELQRSCARKVFYHYAWEKVRDATCREGDDVVIDLPDLPHKADMVRETTLCTDPIWPCTDEPEGRTLHASSVCPGATGAPSGMASLADVDAGAVRRCETCQMDVVAMGNVANASTNIDNGFEHYWRVVVEASKEYAVACKDAQRYEREMQEKAEGSASAFQKAIDLLSVDRPKLTPPGSYGCIAFVWRGDTEVPSQLTSAFLEEGTLPAGVAVAGATLAPDEATDGHNVLSSVFDGLKGDGQPIALSLVGGITDLWGRLLVGYGSSYESVSGSVDGFLDGIGGMGGEKVAGWLRDRISSIVEAGGFAPADMRLRKPVLVNSQTIMDKAGNSSAAELRSFLESLPQDPEGQAKACLGRALEELGGAEFTIAEVPIPGVPGMSIPLTIRLDDLLESG